MKLKRIPIFIVGLMLGGCVASAVPAFADGEKTSADATIMVVLRDLETGASRYMACAPVEPKAVPNPINYH